MVSSCHCPAHAHNSGYTYAYGSNTTATSYNAAYASLRLVGRIARVRRILSEGSAFLRGLEQSVSEFVRKLVSGEPLRHRRAGRPRRPPKTPPSIVQQWPAALRAFT